jgi:hypothetical protein
VTGPIAFTVWDGHGRLPAWRRKLIAAWLTANDISPDDACADHAITILTVPFRPAEAADEGEPWQIQVIALHQYYVNRHGTKEQNLITRKPVTFQRTVPLKVAFPPEPTTVEEGPHHGEEPQVEPVEEGQRPPQHQGGTQEDEQQAVRLAETEEVQGGRPGSCSERVGQGLRSRIASAEEGRSKGRDQEVPQPEEVRRQPQEEVGGA